MVDCTHPNCNLDRKWNLKIGVLEQSEMLLVVAFCYMPDRDIFHFGRKPSVGDDEAWGKMVVGHSFDCHTHYDQPSLVSCWQQIDEQPPQDVCQKWFPRDFA